MNSANSLIPLIVVDLTSPALFCGKQVMQKNPFQKVQKKWLSNADMSEELGVGTASFVLKQIEVPQ